MPIKSFRGKITDLATETIVLHTNRGTTGYRIKKFELMSTQPGQVDGEHIMQIFTVPKTDTALYDNIDFSDPTLLGAAYYEDSATAGSPGKTTIIFDSEIFNQDISITASDTIGALDTNYYIELEQVKLDLNQNTVATLKDIKANS